jgi:hypothetical protein
LYFSRDFARSSGAAHFSAHFPSSCAASCAARVGGPVSCAVSVADNTAAIAAWCYILLHSAAFCRILQYFAVFCRICELRRQQSAQPAAQTAAAELQAETPIFCVYCSCTCRRRDRSGPKHCRAAGRRASSFFMRALGERQDFRAAGFSVARRPWD